MSFELKVGYTEKLGDMTYDVFVTEPSLVGPKFVLACRDDHKKRLRDLQEWVVGVYHDDTPVAAWWGSRDEIQLVADKKYRGKWCTKNVLKRFFDWFFSTHNKALVYPRTKQMEDFLVRLGFRRSGKFFELIETGRVV